MSGFCPSIFIFRLWASTMPIFSWEKLCTPALNHLLFKLHSMFYCWKEDSDTATEIPGSACKMESKTTCPVLGCGANWLIRHQRYKHGNQSWPITKHLALQLLSFHLRSYSNCCRHDFTVDFFVMTVDLPRIFTITITKHLLLDWQKQMCGFTRHLERLCDQIECLHIGY